MSEMNTPKAVFCDVWPNLCSTPCYLCVLSIRDYCDVCSVGALDEHESESNETPVAKSTDTSAETDQQHFKGPAGSFVYEPVPPQEDHPIESLNNEGRTRKDNWIWEIVSIILSIGRVVAITVVLAVLDGKPLSLWDMPIRPNSLVSIFAAVSIVALIFPVAQSISQLKWLYYCEDHHALIDLQRFDDASRGPWGSLLFLWHFRTRALIASFGCLITIMALAVDRFTQQIIECPMRSISMGNSSASISVAYMYDTGLEGTTGRASAQYIDPGMQAAVLSGIYGLSSEPPFNCPSGNCIWPAITALGLCSSCQNVTAETSKTSPAARRSSGLSFNVSQGYSTSPGLTWMTSLNATARTERSWASSNGTNVLTRMAVSRDPGYLQFSNGQDLEHVSYVNSASDLEKRRYGIQYRIFRGGPDGSNYTLNSNDLSSTAIMLAAIFTTDLTEGVSQPAGFEGGDTVDVPRVLHSTGDLGGLMANTTRAMTDFVMGVNASRVEGQAWKEETFVEVHWPWFILPAALVALAVGLLGVCVGEGEGKGVDELWGMREMEDRARAVRAKLGEGGGGGQWRFVLS
ncbi:hypothetical protein GTA08_BOTSDO07874 [Botryosphaeria dothidea]|uniref:Uncharacterized protein n=1 Tax=Botryosphaeria dothidea TaxID=55169 RepID=A0A8H4MYI6_9PEZI|nr:hypothetical protein GTA08_BOTSDO07874 [Botryosphaeria dothidea]